MPNTELWQRARTVPRRGRGPWPEGAPAPSAPLLSRCLWVAVLTLTPPTPRTLRPQDTCRQLPCPDCHPRDPDGKLQPEVSSGWMVAVGYVCRSGATGALPADPLALASIP